MQTLHDIIAQDVIVHAKDAHIASSANGMPSPWIFDFRARLLDATFLDLVAELFWQTCADQYPFQVGGSETASIPIITAIIIKGKERGTPVNGFYIRKSRKPEGLQKIVEGTLHDESVILIDDLLNSGTSFLRQTKVLEELGKRVSAFFALIRFRTTEDYAFIQEKDIAMYVPFGIEDFGLTSSVPKPVANFRAFSPVWKKQYGKPNYFYRVPKSGPVIDESRVYFASDDGIMRALSQKNGEELWKFKIIGFAAQGKTIFSSPVLYKSTLYFGAYDGNFYALDAHTGAQKWIYMDADWIGSSPCVADDLGLVYVGLEYGLWKKRGGVVALDARTGKKKWEYISMPEYTHGSPAYSKKFGVVSIGSNDGCIYLFKASDGTLLWKFQTGGDIKMAPAFDEKRGLVICGSYDGAVYAVHIKDGTSVHIYHTGAGIYSVPLVSGDYVYISSLDKRIYCLNLETFECEWVFGTGGRIFSSPALINNHIYVGSNDGRLYELDAKTGRNTGFFQTIERITNKVAYNKQTGTFFVLTYANELYCLQKA